MDRIERFFLDKANKLSFIELKKGSEIEIKGHKLESQLPLPVITELLLEDIKSGGAEDEISLSKMIDGIIYLFGTDKDFIHNDRYEEIILSFDPKIEDYILYMALEYMKEEDYVNASIYLRAIGYLGRDNEVSLFNYAMCLENIAQSTDNEDLQSDLVLRASHVLEGILDINENFSLAYYKLGFHYKHSQQFLKAKLIWEKYLKLEDDIERQNEVREELDIIDMDVEFEEALVFITQGQYQMALEKLFNISRLSDWWNIDYLIGFCYKNIDSTEKAIEYMEKAILGGGEDSIVYNELAICYFSIGDIKTAIEKFTSAIELDPNNYEALFNRGIAYYKLGLMDEAIKDMEGAYELNPDDSIKKQLEVIRDFKLS